MTQGDADARTDTDRVEAFSDGVFAIAITLLVLELHVPDGTGDGLWHDLLHEWPQFAGYLTSFFVIGIMWVNHHSMFKQIVRADRPLLFLNLLLLLWTSLLPFPTALVSRHLDGSSWDGKIAEALYSATLTFAAIAFSLMWAHAVRGGRLLAAPIGDRAAERRSIARFSIGTLFYSVTIGVSFVVPLLALALQFLLALYYLFEQLTST
ncbi:MAG TPA: TMEM175 family protein [Jatrophihabitantaceae bacterium]|jgi:uncharacterized membrane protein